jgi:hypothetical protein
MNFGREVSHSKTSLPKFIPQLNNTSSVNKQLRKIIGTFSWEIPCWGIPQENKFVMNSAMGKTFHWMDVILILLMEGKE